MKKRYPVNYIAITQGYTSSHSAIDLGWKDNPDTEVYACADGYVENIHNSTDGGNVVQIKYDDGTSSSFLHLKDNSIVVKESDRVSMGDLVAIMGSTGLATGPHLHVIIYDKNGNRQNPLECLYAYPDQTIYPGDEAIVLKYNGDDESNENNDVYIVVKGDTLSGIASKYNTTYQELAEINNIKDPNKIYPGQKIKIPSSGVIYVVQKGDTLSGIASKYNTTWQSIYEKNKDVIGDNPDLIKPGQNLKI